ncbi:hypothetical protein RDI58_005593 [Solanum bulbocastanum]|uniref:Uncharacterized protein n=1 Tax=Solanum bulbocastanum TaxID=147425 RepID=A0AAN8YMU1_SOLBU
MIFCLILPFIFVEHYTHRRVLQHDADERIRLEELCEKLPSGQKRTTTFLDSEQEIVMPEINYQLLHNYADHIQNWGWICNIHSQPSRSFTR